MNANAKQIMREFHTKNGMYNVGGMAKEIERLRTENSSLSSALRVVRESLKDAIEFCGCYRDGLGMCVQCREFDRALKTSRDFISPPPPHPSASDEKGGT